MKRLLSVILSITLLLSMGIATYADGVDEPVYKAKIRVGTSADFKPFEYYDENDKLIGIGNFFTVRYTQHVRFSLFHPYVDGQFGTFDKFFGHRSIGAAKIQRIGKCRMELLHIGYLSHTFGTVTIRRFDNQGAG